MLETPAKPSLRATLSVVRHLAEATASYAPDQSADLITLLGREPGNDGLHFLLDLLRNLAVLRGVLLTCEDAAPAALWEDLIAASVALRAPLIDALRLASPALQEALLARLRAGAAQIPLPGVEAVFARADLCIAAAGDFKRGKSTVINALLGRAVLPMRVAPATA